MNKAGFFFGAVLLLLANVALGNSLVRFPAGNASWTVELTYRDGDEAETPAAPESKASLRCTQLLAQRVGDRRKDILTWSNGLQTETWWTSAPSLVLYEDARIKEIVVTTGGDVFNGLQFDESLFEWIASANMIGEERIKGKNCILYEGKAFGDAETGAGVKTKAWIDKETLLPVATDNGVVTAYFTFAEPPQALPPLPAKFETLLNRYRRATATVQPQKKERIRR